MISTKKNCEEGFFWLFQKYILKRLFFPSFWTNITITIFNTSNMSNSAIPQAEILFARKSQVCRPNDSNNILKARENPIAGVRGGPRFLIAFRIFVQVFIKYLQNFLLYIAYPPKVQIFNKSKSMRCLSLGFWSYLVKEYKISAMPLLFLCTSNWATSQTLRSIRKDNLCSLETRSTGLTVY